MPQSDRGPGSLRHVVVYYDRQKESAECMVIQTMTRGQHKCQCLQMI